jgi:hypothetical protein
MSSIFSKEQLEKLALHTAGINAVLVEALLTLQEPEDTDGEEDVNVEIHVVESPRKTGEKK